jgi:hypothetical protein
LVPALLAGCGGDGGEPAADPFSKVSPSWPKVWHGRTEEEWHDEWARGGDALAFDALWALGETGVVTPRGAEAVRRALAGSDAGLALAALATVGRWGKAAPEDVAPHLVRWMRDERAAHRSAAVTAVGQGPASVVPALVAALRSGDARAKYYALEGLRQRTDAPPSLLPEVLALYREDPSLSVRRFALQLLPHLGAEGVRVAFDASLSDDPAEARSAARAIVAAGDASVATLREDLRSEDELRAARAAQLLADLGRRAAPALEDLLQALRRTGNVRFNAADALLGIGAAALPGLDALAEDATGQVPVDVAELARATAEKIRATG